MDKSSLKNLNAKPSAIKVFNVLLHVVSCANLTLMFGDFLLVLDLSFWDFSLKDNIKLKASLSKMYLISVDNVSDCIAIVTNV